MDYTAAYRFQESIDRLLILWNEYYSFLRIVYYTIYHILCVLYIHIFQCVWRCVYILIFNIYFFFYLSFAFYLSMVFIIFDAEQLFHKKKNKKKTKPKVYNLLNLFHINVTTLDVWLYIYYVTAIHIYLVQLHFLICL